MTTTIDGNWADSYELRSGSSKVHLVAAEKPGVALCGAKTKAWTKPAASSAVCARCDKKAHGEHRRGLTQQAKGRRPTPGQTAVF